MRIAKNYAVIKVQCERFNSTYARLNPALGFESRISKYISRKSIAFLVNIHSDVNCVIIHLMTSFCMR